MNKTDFQYPFEVRPLDAEEGGGFLVTFPDLPGCMSDGESVEEALKNAKDALECWLEANAHWEKQIPEPGTYSGKFIQRLPKSLHARLVQRAKKEGVSMNTLVTAFIAECLGKRTSKST